MNYFLGILTDSCPLSLCKTDQKVLFIFQLINNAKNNQIQKIMISLCLRPSLKVWVNKNLKDIKQFHLTPTIDRRSWIKSVLYCISRFLQLVSYLKMKLFLLLQWSLKVKIENLFRNYALKSNLNTLEPN